MLRAQDGASGEQATSALAFGPLASTRNLAATTALRSVANASHHCLASCFSVGCGPALTEQVRLLTLADKTATADCKREPTKTKKDRCEVAWSARRARTQAVKAIQTAQEIAQRRGRPGRRMRLGRAPTPLLLRPARREVGDELGCDHCRVLRGTIQRDQGS